MVILLVAETDTKNSKELTFCDYQPSQHNPGTKSINPQPLTVDEQGVTPLPSPTNKITPTITSNVNTPPPQKKRNISFEEHQQFINRIKAQMSPLKSHMKCELSTVSSKKHSLSEFVDTKNNNLNNQEKILETLRENIKFL